MCVDNEGEMEAGVNEEDERKGKGGGGRDVKEEKQSQVWKQKKRTKGNISICEVERDGRRRVVVGDKHSEKCHVGGRSAASRRNNLLLYWSKLTGHMTPSLMSAPVSTRILFSLHLHLTFHCHVHLLRTTIGYDDDKNCDGHRFGRGQIQQDNIKGNDPRKPYPRPCCEQVWEDTIRDSFPFPPQGPQLVHYWQCHPIGVGRKDNCWLFLWRRNRCEYFARYLLVVILTLLY